MKDTYLPGRGPAPRAHLPAPAQPGACHAWPVAQALLRPVSEQALLDSFLHQARFHGPAMRHVGGHLKQGMPQKKGLP